MESRIDAIGGTHVKAVSPLPRAASQFLIVACIVALLAYLGIWSYLHHSLAAFWPANAILAAMMARWPALHSPSGWLGALFGFYFALLTAGSTLPTTTLWTAANLSGVVIAVLLLRKLPRIDLELRRPQSVLRVLGIGLLSATAATALGAPVVAHELNLSMKQAIEMRFSTELAGYVTTLFVVLSIPRRQGPATMPTWAQLRSHLTDRGNWRSIASATLFVFTLAMAPTLGGPGALMLAVPVLGWIAVNGSVFTTAVFGLIGAATLEILLRVDRLDPGFDFNAMSSHSQASLRIGLCLMFVGPLMVATTSQHRLDQLAELRAAATFDSHTGVLTRATLRDQAQAAFELAHTRSTQVAAFIIDVDRFKSVNDTYTHAAGDIVLTAVAQRCRNSLRERDLLGRYGGDEFFGLQIGVTPAEAQALALRMCEHVSRDPIEAGSGTINITISIGVAHSDDSAADGFSDLLAEADRALYRVKRQGRGTAALSPVDAETALAQDVIPTVRRTARS